jgi:hypothetical protein
MNLKIDKHKNSARFYFSLLLYHNKPMTVRVEWLGDFSGLLSPFLIKKRKSGCS